MGSHRRRAGVLAGWAVAAALALVFAATVPRGGNGTVRDDAPVQAGAGAVSAFYHKPPPVEESPEVQTQPGDAAAAGAAPAVIRDSGADLAGTGGAAREISTAPAGAAGGLGFEPDDSRELVLSFDTTYDGTGVAVGVRDFGVLAGHPDLFWHVLAGSDTDTVGQQGTAVCSVLAGSGPVDLGCTYQAMGVASGADILFKSTANSYASAFAAWQAAGIQISNHSYSFGGDPYAYTSDTAAFDGYADSGGAVIVAACGDNGLYVTNPALGKNVLAVGAVAYVSYGADNIGEWARYSNPGPTRDDGRLKPDLAAPGGGTDGNIHGVVVANSTPDGIATGDEWPSNDLYTRLSGTGMAAPHVAGVCAKIEQWKPDIHSELLKALLINVTIPTRDNSTDGLAGYASTRVGYGMVNGYSVTSAYAGESQRVLFAEGTVTEDARKNEWIIQVPVGTKKLAVTLAYNDVPGAGSVAKALQDDLELSLIGPDGATRLPHLAPGVTSGSPLEKMVIEDPPSGLWIARVTFADSPSFADPLQYGQQRYGLVGHVILKSPALRLAVAQTAYEVPPSGTFDITATVTNVGGYLATGTRMKAIGPTGLPPGSFGPESDAARFVGNLPYLGAAASTTFHLTAPAQEGTYQLTVTADGNNLEFAAGYPKTQTVLVHVSTSAAVTISGYVRMSNGDALPAVVMQGLAGNPVTDDNGYYVASVPIGWSGTVAPQRPGYTFAPGSRVYSNVTATLQNEDYTASQITFKISGYVRDGNGSGAAGVQMTGLSGPPVTDANGYYEGTVSYGWSGTVTPTQAGWRFTPARQTYSDVLQDCTGQDYVRWQGLDLRVACVTCSAPLPGPTAGQPLQVVVTIENRGTTPAAAAQVDIWQDRATAPLDTGGSDFHQGVVNLLPDPQNAVDLTFNVVYTQPGTYSLWAMVTPTDGQIDPDLSNNLYNLLVEVQPSKPDLIVERVNAINKHPPTGRQLSAAVTIRNQGQSAAGPFRVDLWRDSAAEPQDATGSDAGQWAAGLDSGQSVVLQYDVTYAASGRLPAMGAGGFARHGRRDERDEQRPGRAGNDHRHPRRHRRGRAGGRDRPAVHDRGLRQPTRRSAMDARVRLRRRRSRGRPGPAHSGRGVRPEPAGWAVGRDGCVHDRTDHQRGNRDLVCLHAANDADVRRIRPSGAAGPVRGGRGGGAGAGDEGAAIGGGLGGVRVRAVPVRGRRRHDQGRAGGSDERIVRHAGLLDRTAGGRGLPGGVDCADIGDVSTNGGSAGRRHDPVDGTDHVANVECDAGGGAGGVRGDAGQEVNGGQPMTM